MTNPICAVCYDKLSLNLRETDQRPVCAMGCGHVFHYFCISKWLRERNVGTCPQCMTPLAERHLQKLLVEVDAVHGGDENATDIEGAAAAALPTDECSAWKTRCTALEKRTKDLEDENQTLKMLLEESNTASAGTRNANFGFTAETARRTPLIDPAAAAGAAALYRAVPPNYRRPRPTSMLEFPPGFPFNNTSATNVTGIAATFPPGFPFNNTTVTGTARVHSDTFTDWVTSSEDVMIDRQNMRRILGDDSLPTINRVRQVERTAPRFLPGTCSCGDCNANRLVSS